MPFDFDRWKQAVLVFDQKILSECVDPEKQKSDFQDIPSISDFEAMLDEIERDTRESRYRLN